MADPSAAPPLPGLATIMRGGREALTRAGIVLAQETFGLGLDRLAALGPDALAQLARR